MSLSIIFTDQHAPDGRTIRYNLDTGTRTTAAIVEAALNDGTLLEIPNEVEGEEPIFVNPERVATITPVRKGESHD